MPLTPDIVRQIVKDETVPIAKNVEVLLKKVDGFLQDLETGEQERVLGDAHLERRIGALERRG